jgi:hypothetical protein
VTLTASPEAREASLREWAGLRARLQTVSPRALARGALLVTAVAVPAWVAIVSWPALLPFAAGVVLAYAVLPLANRLDRYMPRFLAALVSIALALGILIGAVLVIVPPLIAGVVDVVSSLPSTDQVQAAIERLQEQLGNVPQPFGGVLLVVAGDVIGNLHDVLSGFVDGFGQFVTEQILGILNTVSFVLGLFVIPVWILTLVSDERRIKARSTRIVTPALQRSPPACSSGWASSSPASSGSASSGSPLPAGRCSACCSSSRSSASISASSRSSSSPCSPVRCPPSRRPWSMSSPRGWRRCSSRVASRGASSTSTRACSSPRSSRSASSG